MKQVAFLLMATVISAFGMPVFAKNPELVPAALETCDGTTWSGLTLGKTTARDIKKQFRTGRSDLPMSQELSQPREAKQKVFALYSDKHDDSPLAAILLRYSDNGPDLAALSRAAGVPERDYYEVGRLEDWKLATFPGKSIVAFELTEYGHQTVPLIVLCAPSGVAAVCRGFSTSRQPVVERNDPHANEPRVMEFGTAAVNTDLKGLELKTGEKQDVERTMIDTTAGGTMRYRVGAPGSYTTEVSGYFTPDKGGSLSVTSTISGSGPYGPISVSGSSNKSLPAVKDMATAYSGVNSTNYTIALYEALEKASSSFRDAMIASGPPPIQTVRLQKWQELVEDFRAQRQAASDYIPAGGFAGTPSGGGGGPTGRPLSPEMQDSLKKYMAKAREDYVRNLNVWVSIDKDQQKRIQEILGDGMPPIQRINAASGNAAEDDRRRMVWQALTAPQQAVITRIGARPPGEGDEYYHWLTNALLLTGGQSVPLKSELDSEMVRRSADRKDSFRRLAAGQPIDFQGQMDAARQEDKRLNGILSPSQKAKYETLRPGTPDFITPLAAQTLRPPTVAPASFAPASVVPAAPAQSLFTFANGAQAVGTLLSFDGSFYTVSTAKGMRQFKKAAIASIRALTVVPGAAGK